MTREILNVEEMENVSGGTRDEVREFRKISAQKGYGYTLQSMPTAERKMLGKIGIPHVDWHSKDNKPADFWDDKGTHYNFEEVKSKLSEI